MNPTACARLALSWLFCLAALVNAIPIVDKSRRDVVDPPITSPDNTTVWVVGTVQTVTWDTSVFAGQNLSTTQGQILLGFLNDTSGNEHLNTTNPLASGFNITTGSVNITVPDVLPGNDYIIALLGDSGNISPTFTITNSSSPGSGPITPSTTLTIPSGPTTGISTASQSNAGSPTSTQVIVISNGSQTGAPVVIMSSKMNTSSSNTANNSNMKTNTGSTATQSTGTTTNTAVAQSAVSNTNSALAQPIASKGTLVAALVAVFALL